jgi:hypothetical protein
MRQAAITSSLFLCRAGLTWLTDGFHLWGWCDFLDMSYSFLNSDDKVLAKSGQGLPHMTACLNCAVELRSRCALRCGLSRTASIGRNTCDRRCKLTKNPLSLAGDNGVYYFNPKQKSLSLMQHSPRTHCRPEKLLRSFSAEDTVVQVGKAA